ncbi:hypothetical protein PYCC9005_001301 [Savitreella phatthalungensis]
MGFLLHTLTSLSPATLAVLLLSLLFLLITTTLFSKPQNTLKWVPGPWLARYSDLWLFYHARAHRRFRAVHEAHQTHGRFVRIAPNHISIAIADAIPIVYGHGTGTLKADFYDAFVSIHRGLFNTRDRADHTRKRKIVSSVFSAQNVTGFEPYVQKSIRLFLHKLDSLIQRQGGQAADFDFLPWANYLAFDIIGDLAFGTPFGFLEAERDTNDGIRVLNERGEWSATVGTMVWIKPWTPWMIWDKFFTDGLQSVRKLAQIAITAVDKRIGVESDRKDLLSFLLKARNEDGTPLPKTEIQAEALTQLIAGSDTTSNSLTHFLDVLCRNPEEYARLQQSIDEMMEPLGDSLATFADVQHNKHLLYCIWEALRVQPTSAMGLPREVAGPEPLDVCGHRFPPGTVLSVPSYTVHHDPAIYPNPEKFKPDRWAAADAPGDKQFIPFSYGPRACVGRNVAMLELQTVLANLLYNFEFRRQDPHAKTVLREGFLLKPTRLDVTMTRRRPFSPP